MNDGGGRRYVKALPLVGLEDVELVKTEIGSGNIVILRITPLARRSVEDLKEAVNLLKDYAERVGGDIARLGEERIVLTPADVKIWRS
ncbi:MAG: cell division protein SepF [Candidatus Bathyarchaeia archaeon]